MEHSFDYSAIKFNEVVLMGYRINYGSVVTREALKDTDGNKTMKLFSVILITVAVLMSVCYIRYGNLMPIFYPGDPRTTKSAADAMIESLEGGMPVVEAFGDFCVRILQQEG